MSEDASAAKIESDTPVASTTDEPELHDEGALCAICRTARLGDSIRTVNGNPACDACIADIQRELAEQRTPASAFATATGGGIVGALLGAAVWAAIAIAAEAEVGYVAVLVGFLAGLGVKLGARSARSVGLQRLAAGLALFGLVAAKYMTMAYLLVDLAKQSGVELGYLDPRFFEVFPEYLQEIASPFDLLWIFLALGSAYKVPKPVQVAIQ